MQGISHSDHSQQQQHQHQFIPKLTEQEQEAAINIMLYLKASVHGLLATIHHLRTENQNLRKENFTLKYINEALTQECRALKNQLLFVTTGQIPQDQTNMDSLHHQNSQTSDLLSLDNPLAIHLSSLHPHQIISPQEMLLLDPKKLSNSNLQQQDPSLLMMSSLLGGYGVGGSFMGQVQSQDQGQVQDQSQGQDQSQSHPLSQGQEEQGGEHSEGGIM